jgi:hypothetical protein
MRYLRASLFKILIIASASSFAEPHSETKDRGAKTNLQYSKLDLNEYLDQIVVVSLSESLEKSEPEENPTVLFLKYAEKLHSKLSEQGVKAIVYDIGFENIEIEHGKTLFCKMSEGETPTILIADSEDEQRTMQKKLGSQSNVSYGHCKLGHGERPDLPGKHVLSLTPYWMEKKL